MFCLGQLSTTIMGREQSCQEIVTYGKIHNSVGPSDRWALVSLNLVHGVALSSARHLGHAARAREPLRTTFLLFERKHTFPSPRHGLALAGQHSDRQPSDQPRRARGDKGLWPRSRTRFCTTRFLIFGLPRTNQLWEFEHCGLCGGVGRLSRLFKSRVLHNASARVTKHHIFRIETRSTHLLLR